MKYRRINSAAIFCATLATVCLIASTGTASTRDELRLPVGSRAPLPVAFAVQPTPFDWSAVFGTTTSPESESADTPVTIELDAALQRQIEDLNVALNAAHRDERGARIDCVGYVQRKRAALLAAGLPADALSAAIVITPGGVSHTVLVLSTDHGDLVLDNLTPYVLPWRQTEYIWIEREVAGRTPGSQSRWAWITRPSMPFVREAASR